MLDKLTYNDERHEYRYAGDLVPSVTQVLAPLSAAEYRGVDPALMERAAQLGRAMHRMIELDIKGDLDADGLSDLLVPYYTAWLNFRALSGFEPILSEQFVYADRYRYAGTLDMFGRLRGRLVLIDAKRTSAVPRTAGPQTAGYEMALRACKPEITGGASIDRYALHLQTDGKWKLVPFTDKNDSRVFLSALTLHTWSNAA